MTKSTLEVSLRVSNTCTLAHIAEDIFREITTKVAVEDNIDPPQLDNQRDLTLWVCRQHNYVNKILGKSQFPCEYEKLMERWKTGCDSDDLWAELKFYPKFL